MPQIRARVVHESAITEVGLTLSDLEDFVTAAKVAGASPGALLLASEFRDGHADVVGRLEVHVPTPSSAG